MKYLEQRIQELELEVKLLKAKNKLNDTSSYLNNYPPYNNPNSPDYMYNHSDTTLLSAESDLETTFASPWDTSEKFACSIDTIKVGLSSTVDDTSSNSNYIDSSDLPQCYPPYPEIIGSYDNFDWNTMKDWASFNQTDEIPPYPGHYNTNFLKEDKNFNDVINENVIDDYGFKMNDDVITSWGFKSDFDKQDRDFLAYLNSTEKKIEKDFGKIISKFKILTHEWEMDGYGYIVSDLEYNKNAIVTNHGKPMVVNKSYLNDIISEYKERIQDTQRALFLINE
jgi:hypothetical protein